MLNEPLVIAGVDTHKDTHYAAVITITGEHIGAAEFPTTEAGYDALTSFITCHGTLLRAGVEGTNSYGAGLTRHLHEAGVQVVEVIRPARQVRRMRGKSDPIDAYTAAHTALANNNTVTAKTSDGLVEAIRVTYAARRSALKARTEVIVQLKSLIVTAPEAVREEYRGLSTGAVIAKLAGSRARAGDDEVAACTRSALKRLAVRYQQLNHEMTTYDTDLARLVQTVNPALVQTNGIATITAAQLLITAGDNPDRLHSEAAFAMLCGAAPLPASSGKTNRYRLNRGGDRAANSALHKIAIVRMATDPETRRYVARRISEGKTKKDILRCLKRAIAREVFHLITNPQPAADSSDLRPTRKTLGLTLTEVAEALDCSLGKISRIERGHVRDTRFLDQYRTWLTTQQQPQIAA
ncbi:MAG TPA: IS110 family transposase [Microbacteriaceae bacterium]